MVLKNAIAKVIFSKTLTETIIIKHKKTNTVTWYVNEKFLIRMTYYKSLEGFGKILFKDNIFANVDWNFYHEKPEIKPETWYENEKFF